MKVIHTHYRNWKIRKIMKKIKLSVIPPHRDNHFYVIFFNPVTIDTRV